MARLEQELSRVLQQRDALDDQLRRIGGGGGRKVGNQADETAATGIIHSVHILTGGENTNKSSQQNNIINSNSRGGGGSSNSYYHPGNYQQQQHPYHPARLLSQSETNLAAAAVAEGAINIEIRHNNSQANVNNSNVNNSSNNNVENLSRSSGDLISGRLGGGVLKNGGGGGSVSVVNLPAVVNNNSSNSSAEELYHGYNNNNNNNGGESSNPLFPRFGGGGSSNNSRYNNFLYPDRNSRGFFPHQATAATHNTSSSSNSNLTAFGRGGQLHHLLSQERLFHNRSRSVENLFDQQGTLLRHAATASDISLQPRPSAGSYYGEPLVAGPLRSAASAVAVGGGRVHQQQQQQRMKATQSEQLLTKIGKLEKVNRSYCTALYCTLIKKKTKFSSYIR